MDNKTKAYYRNKIKEISKKTKISELYITRKILELAQQNPKSIKESHIGYYLIDAGTEELYKALNYKARKAKNQKLKQKYILQLSHFLQ